MVPGAGRTARSQYPPALLRAKPWLWMDRRTLRRLSVWLVSHVGDDLHATIWLQASNQIRVVHIAALGHRVLAAEPVGSDFLRRYTLLDQYRLDRFGPPSG